MWEIWVECVAIFRRHFGLLDFVGIERLTWAACVALVSAPCGGCPARSIHERAVDPARHSRQLAVATETEVGVVFRSRPRGSVPSGRRTRCQAVEGLGRRNWRDRGNGCWRMRPSLAIGPLPKMAPAIFLALGRQKAG